MPKRILEKGNLFCFYQDSKTQPSIFKTNAQQIQQIHVSR